MSVASRRPARLLRSVVACAALASAAVALSGCTQVHGGSAASAGNVVRIPIGADPPGLNPLVFDNANVTYLSALIHGYLLRTDSGGRLIPDLATEVPTAANAGISRDGLIVTYHLRRGVRWHDGAPFTAADVLFSQSAAMNPANNVPDRTGYDRVARIDAPDAYTVRVRLKAPFSPFVGSFLSESANDPYPILPAHLLAHKHDLNADPYNGDPVGLGPYEFVRWERGSRIVLASNPNYFRGKPAIDRIEIEIVPQINTAVAMWKAGEADLIVARTTTGRQVFSEIASRAGAHVVLKPHNEFEFLIFNTAHPPLDDRRVRHALVLGIDRNRIMRELDGDLWVPGDTDRLPGTFAYDPSIVQPRYDPAAAARELDGAGWRKNGLWRTKNGRVLSLDAVSTTESTATVRFNILMQQELAKLGIRTELKAYSYNIVWAGAKEGGINQTGRYDIEYSGWQPNSVDDHSYLFRCETRPPNGDNLTRVCDPVIEAAAREELTSTDPARQAAGDRAIARELIAQSDLLFLGFTREAVAAREGLDGVEPSVTGEHLWNAWAWRLSAKGR